MYFLKFSRNPVFFKTYMFENLYGSVMHVKWLFLTISLKTNVNHDEDYYHLMLWQSLFCLSDKKLSWKICLATIYGGGHENVKHRDKYDEIRNRTNFTVEDQEFLKLRRKEPFLER